MRNGEERERAYGVASAEFLLCADDGAASLGCVESGFAPYDCLSCGATPAGLAANFRYGIPVIHCICGVCLKRDSGGYQFRVERFLFVATGGSVCGGCGGRALKYVDGISKNWWMRLWLWLWYL